MFTSRQNIIIVNWEENLPDNEWCRVLEKLKEIEKLDKYLELNKELEKLRNLNGSVVSNIVVNTDIVLKSFVKEVEKFNTRRRIETI